MKIVHDGGRSRRLIRSALPAALALALSQTIATTAFAQQADPPPDPPDDSPTSCPEGADPDAPCPLPAAGVQDLQTVEVRGVRGSIASAIALKQQATEITDSIVAEDIGKLPDNSVAAALQRVTGVQVTRGAGEVGTVLVRGLPNVVTTLNGRNVFTTTGRGIALADIPADLLQRVDVYKTSAAEHIEGGIAGLIDVRLRRPFDFEDGWTLAGGLRAVRSEQSGKTDPIGSLTVNRLWDSGVGKMGLMASASYQSQRYLESNTFNGTYDLIANPADPAEQVFMPFVVGSIYSRGDRDRKAANVSFQWQPSERSEIYFDGFYVGYQNDSQLNFWIPLPGLANPDNTESVTLRPDSNVVDSVVARDMFTLTSNQAFDDASDTWQGAVGWKWTGDNAVVNTELAYTYSTADNRSFILDTAFIAPRLRVDFSNGGASDALASNADGSAFDVTDPSHYWLEQYYDAWSRQEGKDWSWKTDATFFVDAGPVNAIDAGVRASLRKAINIAADTGGRFNVSGSQVFVDDIPGLADVTPGGLLDGEREISTSRWMIPNRRFLLDQSSVIRTAMGHDPAAPQVNPALFFDDAEDTYAAYLQANYALDIGDMPLTGRLGVRVVRLDSELKGTEIVDGVQSPVDIDKSDTEVLPNFSANLALRDDLLLRLGLGKSVTRPDFEALNPQLSLFQETETLPARGSGGNPDLDSVESTNTDLSLEWYFKPGSLLSATAFHRDIEGYIQTYASDEVIDGVSYSITRPRNTGSGSLKGIELAYTQFFDFLPGWLSGFGTQLNTTFISAETESPTGEMQDLVNVSDRAWNAILIYQRDPISARLAYNWRDDYAISFSETGAQPSAIYVAPVESLDFQLNYDVNPHMTLSLEATNLLGKATRNYFGDEYLYPRDVGSAERTISFGLRFRL
ncbi:TonB-dependent receptor [Luteimonas suaedae]|uniref:TonB-dependent receptor n=1 Tax=Luteimonas suaedae TaxID=2605430 RepID=UPI0011ED7F60|nr:TonB-dependent receptor [Luteimonas suaedae]